MRNFPSVDSLTRTVKRHNTTSCNFCYTRCQILMMDTRTETIVKVVAIPVYLKTSPSSKSDSLKAIS